jgi:two-component system, chemotaxis family, chemotaxis protein CheY
MDNVATAPETVDSEAMSACVLIVDDDAATREICSINLQHEGLRVLEATDGHHGLARARLDRPDLVLTDVRMPGLDGFELAEALRGHAQTKAIPLIFLSGELAAADRARATGLGAFAYVTKPFDPVALAALIAKVLATAGGDGG